MIANALIAMCFVGVAVAVGWLGYGMLLQRRELDACARTLRDLVEAFNTSPVASPEGPRVTADPELPWVPPQEAPMNVEAVVKLGGVAWAEWRPR